MKKRVKNKKTESIKNKKPLIKNPILKGILSAVAIVVIGFILLNLTFLFDFIYQTIIRAIIRLFISYDEMDMNFRFIPPLMHLSFAVLICIISYFIFKSKLKTIYKAIYSTVPLAVIYATIGIFLYQWQIAVYLLGFLFSAGVLYYLYKTKQPWMFYFSWAYIIILMLIVMMFQIEI
jgi:hypothetical protein